MPTWSLDDAESGVDAVMLASALGSTGVVMLSGVLLLIDAGFAWRTPCIATVLFCTVPE